MGSFRSFKSPYRTSPSLGFIDGTFIEELTNLSVQDMEAVMEGSNQHERIDKSKEDVIRVVEELQRMH